MALGPTNSNGAEGAEIQAIRVLAQNAMDAVKQLAADVMSGSLSVELATTTGEIIQTAAGEDILAVRTISSSADREYTDAAIRNATAGIMAVVDSCKTELNSLSGAILAV